MASYRRRVVVRFIWDFCKKPVLATKLPSTRRWFKDYYPEVGGVIVELIGKEGNIYIRFNWRKNIPYVKSGAVVKLLSNSGVLRTGAGLELFEGISPGRPHPEYNEICVRIEPVNGEHFTLTAMKRCKTLFELLGMDVEKSYCLPLVGNFMQESFGPTDYYMDFGTQLYVEVFQNMPPASKLFKASVNQAT